MQVYFRGYLSGPGGSVGIKEDLRSHFRFRAVLFGTIALAGYCVFLWFLRNSSYRGEPLLDAYVVMAGV